MLNTILLIIIPFIALLLPEIIIRGHLGAIAWISNYPTQFMVSYAILFGLINTLYVLPRRIYAAGGVLAAALLAAGGFVSHQKLILRGEPLLPWDFRISKEALNISQHFEYFNSVPASLFIVTCLLIAAMGIGFRLIPKENYRFPQKFSTALLSLALVLILVQPVSLQKAFSLELIAWNQKANYTVNGMALSFILNANANRLAVQEPESYQKSTIKNIVYQEKPAADTTNSGFAPNIIVVMSEAFWDPTVMEGISFSEDPLPYFHSLQQSYTSGVVLTPVYGGGTANTEFEVLTGFSTQFFPQGTTPYVQYVHKPLEALPAILKSQGYKTTAVHTYHDWFYRRNSVYQYLGFDRFISQESFINPEYRGNYIRDTELARKILYVMQETSQPDFIFAVSMQAHGPYSSDENPHAAVKVNGDLQPETKAILENYTNIIADVDKSLELLIEGVRLIKEPTMVVFFGDHLPLLGNAMDVYREAGYIRDDMEDDFAYSDYWKKYSTPILVWDNFSTPGQNLRLSANFLGPYILGHSMKTGSTLTGFLSTLYAQDSAVLTPEQYRHHENLSTEDCAKYALLQYDCLIGNEYVYKFNPLNKPIVNHKFVLGHGPVVVNNVLYPDNNMLEIQGMDFCQNHVVYVNDSPVDTEFVDGTLLKAALPVADLNSDEALFVQVKLTDHWENIITESEVYTVIRPLSVS